MTILKSDFSKIILLFVLSLLLFIPFSNKAISSDSIFYIYTARQILKEPLKPFSFQINCADKNYTGWDVANNPPLISYFLAGVIKIFGEGEKVLHLIFLSFTLLAVIGIYLLANELKIDPFYSALLLIASPAFFVNATDIMFDVPLLAFSLWGIYFVIRNPASQCGVNSIGWILLGLAVLIKFVAVLNLPIVFVWLLLNKKLKNNIFYFLIPILFLVLWSLHNKIIYNEVQIFRKSLDVGLFFNLNKEIPVLTYIGGSFIFPLSILWLVFQVKKSAMWIFVVISTLINLFFNLLGYKILQNVLFSIFISSTILLIFAFMYFLKKTYYQTEIIFLTFWFLLYLVFFTSVSAIIAVRYLIPILPPAIILFVKISEGLPVKKIFLSLTAFAGIVLSVLLAHSDYMLANSYRDISEYVKTNYTGKNVYFTGHLGFQYYMEKNGFIAVDSNNRNYRDNSILVSPVLPVPQNINQDVIEKLKFIEDKYVFTKNPSRTISPQAQAGFHLNMYGLLPYSFSKMPLEKYAIYKIK
ncbi:MAG: glycosyltransferase family 39 protein [Elusimicrobia bacterium]|nr:glycosyltransferase family 39 protein [Elusimicrobiota bacterium]